MSQIATDLFQQAEHLVNRDPKKPKQANLRRAVSSAYYGLFHFLIEEAVQQIIGSTNNVKPLRLFAARAFSHTAMRDACLEFSKSTPKPILKNHWAWIEQPDAPSLASVARTFVQLQQDRHRADYDLATPFTKAEAIAIVESSVQATKDWKKARKCLPDAAQMFCLSLILWGNLKNR